MSPLLSLSRSPFARCFLHLQLVVSTDLLVNFSRESVQNRLVASLYKENLFQNLLYEDEGLTAERNRIKALLQAYKEAFAVSFFIMTRGFGSGN